ncbi:DNAJC14 [Mytilus coruscus]|uniref:DNAJC14 n=1 Tax=Mytilus coruscus TaxID=42192 RepID=A0A6J8BX72_MYTCO|nr:DNAJC14 [Mytilus coruscus]
MYSTWTQFSGMPIHNQNVNEQAGMFNWDAFTPPSSPSTYDPAIDSTQINKDLLTNIQNLLSVNPTSASFEHDLRATDPSPHRNLSMSDASNDGRDIYADAYNNWNSFSQSYDPFGSPTVISKSNGDVPSTFSSGDQQSSNKMTYSDVAKTLKGKPMQATKDKEETDSSKKKTSTSFLSAKPFKPIRKPYYTRQGSKGHTNNKHSDDMASNVTPDSKYGLDQFEEFAVSQDQRSDSTESIPRVLSRKGSTSSVSSGTSGIEEIHLTKPAPQRKPSHDNATVLNNGKVGTKASSAHKKSTDNIYINNDLSDSYKRNSAQNRDGESRKHDNFVQNGKIDKKCKSEESSKDIKGHLPLQSPFDQEYIDEWINFLFEVQSFLYLSFAYLVSNIVLYVIWTWGKVSHFVKTRILNKYFKRFFKQSELERRKLGVDENIALPSTGSEAMQRLLACKGKDPYSILGLRFDCCDDDIRKYYRKQAILVHPDKNKQPGAEEAFKVLGRAFKLIGSTDLRIKYDTEFRQADEAEAAMKEFNDLLTKLQDKMQEAANMMRCDNCGGKHRRVFIDRPWYSARFCKRCNVRHSAKEGDVWAETTMFGFLWHYYACMEGKIYDITEWVACKKDFFKHMQASAHHVFYRIATEGNRGGAQQGRTGEADLEDFINNLFQQAMHTEGSTQWQPPQPSQPSQPSAQGKKTRRRKKKH